MALVRAYHATPISTLPSAYPNPAQSEHHTRASITSQAAQQKQGEALNKQWRSFCDEMRGQGGRPTLGPYSTGSWPLHKIEEFIKQHGLETPQS